ncbi:MAG: biopolymer transporter ExbD [Spirochaetota bacterium]
MKIRKSKRDMENSSWASMSDIAFLLIIFFMISSAFMFREGINLILPDSSKSVTMKSSDLFFIKLKKDSTIEVEKRKIEIPMLKDKLKEFISRIEDGAVIIQVEAQTEYSAVIDVIDSVRSSGAHKLSIKMI